MSDIRVRFAPSPTGYLHIGGARTALFNWLFARKTGGTFILRIEDTDRERSTEESIQAILQSMDWLGLDYNEGPFRQTERMDIYKGYADKLMAEGKAYRCYCTAEDLDERRKQALAEGRVPKYDGRCRDLKEAIPDKSFAVRFKAPQDGQTIVNDMIKGAVTFENSQLDDLIILRSDGNPTYNFCVVVDDADMRVTHVVRGDDHLNNTPRQVLMYRAMELPEPIFAHVPMILGSDKTRLSKRHGATSVMVYKEMGYLPDALVNYLVRLGWSHGDQEIFTREELVEKFSVEAVGKSAAVFNPDKLLWLNSHYINHADIEHLLDLTLPFLKERGLITDESTVDRKLLGRIIQSLRERSRTLIELADSCRYFLAEDIEIDPTAREKHLKPERLSLLDEIAEKLDALDEFSHDAIEKIFHEVKDAHGVKLGDLAQPVRVALTGNTVSPGIFEVIEIMGREKVLRRLRQAVAV
ncbi:MAG: glutamate--tRNA ligase [Nitrospirota bacterium]|nr:glutamate--tRNA ligase [Nitrospirota bacterium]